MKCGRVRGNKREATIWTAHTVTVNSLIESNKQTNKQTNILVRRNPNEIFMGAESNAYALDSTFLDWLLLNELSETELTYDRSWSHVAVVLLEHSRGDRDREMQGRELS
jgi:hypothetical protein